MNTKFIKRMTADEVNARRAANEFKNAPTHRVNVIDAAGVERMSAPAWGLDMAETIAAARVASFPSYKVEIETTDTPETIAPDFDTLSHAAQNVALYVDNDGETYRKLLRPLTEQITRRLIKGAPVELRHLAECSTMAKITLVGVRECRRWGIRPTKDDRRAAALYLAGLIIDTARKEAAR